jgi:hypothetical protein
MYNYAYVCMRLKELGGRQFLRGEPDIPVYVCMCVCGYVCINMRMYVCMHAMSKRIRRGPSFYEATLHVCVHVCMYVCMYSMHERMRIYEAWHSYLCVYAYA